METTIRRDPITGLFETVSVTEEAEPAPVVKTPEPAKKPLLRGK